MPDDFKTDGWINFSGGMRSADGARSAVGDDQAEILVNATVRDGRAEPRPAFKKVDHGWQGESQLHFERGIIQGSGYYDGPHGGRWIYIADGHILSFDPRESVFKNVSPNGERPFHPLARHAYVEQRGKWMVCQDGINPPVYLEGDSAIVNSDAFNGIPIGKSMADGWHRLVVASANGRRLYISDHEFDPYKDTELLGQPKPLQFTDDATYFGNARYFEVPRKLGKITGATFAPSFSSQNDWGPLLVFCQNGTRAYQMQVPREDWLSQDIGATILPTIGASSHGSIVARGNDVLFSDQNGRIQSFKAAIARRDDRRIEPIDDPVWPLYRDENPRYRSSRKSTQFDDRIIFTVWPESVTLGNGRQAIRHRGFVVLEEDHISDRVFVWGGLWTGIYPVAIDSGGMHGETADSPEERCFAVSLDPDGINRLYEIAKKPGPDLMPEPRRVPMWIVPRWLDYESPFRTKSIQAAALQLTDMAGRVSISGWWQSSNKPHPAKWFDHEERAANCIQFGECGIINPAPSGVPRLNLSATAEQARFYRGRPWLRINGQAAVEEGIFEAGIDRGSPGSTTKCKVADVASFHASDCLPNFWEPHSLTFPIEPPLKHQPC